MFRSIVVIMFVCFPQRMLLIYDVESNPIISLCSGNMVSMVEVPFQLLHVWIDTCWYLIFFFKSQSVNP